MPSGVCDRSSCEHKTKHGAQGAARQKPVRACGSGRKRSKQGAPELSTSRPKTCNANALKDMMTRSAHRRFFLVVHAACNSRKRCKVNTACQFDLLVQYMNRFERDRGRGALDLVSGWPCCCRSTSGGLFTGAVAAFGEGQEATSLDNRR